MNTHFSDKTLKFTYKEFSVSIYDIKLHDGKWFFAVTVTSPLNKDQIKDQPLFSPGFDCADDNQALETAKQYAISWIEKTYF